MKGYQGLFFSDENSAILVKKQLCPLENVINDMHITFCYGNIIPYMEEQCKNVYRVMVTGYACDGKNSAFKVELSDDLNRLYYNGNVPPHITVSIGNGGKPKNSAYLKFEKLEHPFAVEGSLQNRIW